MNLFAKKPWMIYLLLFFLPPVGLFLMYKTKKFNKPVRFLATLVFGFIFLIQLVIAFSEPSSNTTALKDTAPAISEAKDLEDSEASTNNEPQEEVVANLTPANATLKVHFIDVGQADSILIQAPNGNAVLVDAGNNEDGPFVVDYLKSQGVKRLSAFVATHSHEDHIGGADNVLKSFTVDKVYMPNAISTTKTFEDMLLAISSSGAKKIQVNSGVTLEVNGLSGEFLAPNSTDYEDLNDYSAVLKITHGSTSFLLTGDAEAISELEMVGKSNLKATVLKVGHHGSDSSTTESFLKKVNPQYAVISVGAGNTYGHPTNVVLNRLAAAGVTVYRTDKVGSVVATSDGNTVTMNTKATPTLTPTPSQPSTGGSVQITGLDLSGEVITLKNTSDSAVNLTGWKIVSEVGNQTFNFPSGTTIPAGGTLQVLSGKDSTVGSNQLLWGQANIWNNKGDTGALYNAQGALVWRR